jgi:hypothetical protein
MIVCVTGCFHWGRIDNIAEVEGASRVRIEPEGAPAYVLEHPTAQQVSAVAQEQHAHAYVKRLNVWATALIITGAVLATAATGLFLLALAAAGIAGG